MNVRFRKCHIFPLLWVLRRGMAVNLPDVVENLANSHESIGDSPIDIDDVDLHSGELNGDSVHRSDFPANDDKGADDSFNSISDTGFEKKDPPVTHTDASDVSSNDLSGPEDGECDSEEERGKPEFTKTHYRQSVKLRQSVQYTVPPLEPTPVISEHETGFDLPLEDISPERDTEELEVQDPYTDFVPPEAQSISPLNTFPLEESTLDKKKPKKKKDKKKRRRDSEGRKSKDEKKRKYSEEDKYVGSPISSGPDNLDNTSPIGDSPISSGEDNWTAPKYHKQVLQSSDKSYFKPVIQSVNQIPQRNLVLPKPTPAGSSFIPGPHQTGQGYQQHQIKSYTASLGGVASASTYTATSVFSQSSYTGGQVALGYQLSSATYSSSTSYQLQSGQAAVNFSVPPPNLRNF